MANDHIRPFSLVRLSFIAIGVLVLSSVLAVMALAGVQTSSQSAVAAWRHFADQASVEQRALRAFATQAGVGGLIDGYYRLAVSGDESLLPMVYGRGGAAYFALAGYPIDDAQEPEVKARATLLGLTRAYVERVGPIMAMHRAGRPVKEILAAARVDSEAAVVALQTLAAATARSMMVNHTLSDTKALILLDVRRLLGLEGLVQNANRYLLDDGDVSLGRVRNDVADMKIALERYRSHSLTTEEAAALERLASEMDGIEPKLTESKKLGQTSVDTTGIQAAVGELEKIVYAEAVTAQENLQTTLDKISAQAGTIIVLVTAGIVILLAGSVWLLLFRIGRRIKAITQTMRALAGGRLDAEIPGTTDHDEIGDMSRALLVFRDNMRANAALTNELAENSRLASLGAMVAGMAHELNTPIGNALSVSSTLEEQCKTFRKDLGSERLMRSSLERHATNLEEAASLIQRNVLRAAAQIGSFKQVAVDQTSGRRREFHLDDVLASVVQSMAPQLKRTPFKLACGEATGAVMESYPGALSQVISNLIENAVKHGLAGQPAGRIDVLTRRLGPHFTEIIVSDDGIGIPEEIKPSIFQAFFTTKAGKGGSGLGLHIVKSIVCGPLGGQISVHSDPGKGSRFIITLPNKAPAEPAPTSSTERSYYAAAQHAA